MQLFELSVHGISTYINFCIQAFCGATARILWCNSLLIQEILSFKVSHLIFTAPQNAGLVFQNPKFGSNPLLGHTPLYL